MKNTIPQLITLSLGVALAPLALSESITDNEVEDINPIISGDLIVWESRVADVVVEPPIEPSGESGAEGEEEEAEDGADFEIMLSTDGVVRQITNNDGDDIHPSISGNDIVWQAWDGNDWEIWAYNVTSDSLRQMTMNETDDINPQIDDNRIVWQTWDGTDFEIATELINLEPVGVAFKLTPRSLNLGSKGKWMNAQIKFSDSGVSPADVDPASIFLEGDIPPESVKIDKSAIKMKFSRSALQAKLAGTVGSVEVTITAQTFDLEDMLVGTSTIKVLPAKGKK